METALEVEKKHEGPFRVVIDGRAYQVPRARVTVLELRALAAIPPAMQLIVEGQGSSHDVLLQEEDSIDVSKGAVIFSRTPAAFGNPSSSA